MTKTLEEIEIRNAAHWRKWLETHHGSSPGVWLIFHKGHTGVGTLAYEDAVCHALAFGWIDSLVRRIDEDRYARKFTPRRPGSKWSDINRKRWKKLESEGSLAPAGRAAAPTSNSYTPPPKVPELPSYIAQAFRAEPRAWRFFQSLAPTYRRHFVGWIHTAKRAETRERRIRESIALLRAGKRLGLK